MSIFSKIGGALKGAAKVATAPAKLAAKAVSAPANLLGSAVSHVPVVGGAVGGAIKGVGNLGGMVTGGLPGFAANHFLGGAPPHPSMGGIGMAMGQPSMAPPPPMPGPIGMHAPSSGGFSGALGSATGGYGGPNQPVTGPGSLQEPPPGMGAFLPHMLGQNGMPAQGGAPGGIMAILKAQMQKSQGPDATSLLRSKYPGMGASNEAGNGSE